jgi:hypothetical protein
MAGSVFLNDDVTEMQAYFRAEDMTDGLGRACAHCEWPGC